MASGGSTSMKLTELLDSIGAAANDKPQYDHDEDLGVVSESDTEPTSDEEDGKSPSKRKPKTGLKSDYTVMQKSEFGLVDGKFQWLCGSIKFPESDKLGMVSNPLNVSGNAEYSFGKVKKTFHSLSHYTGNKNLKFTTVAVFEGTTPVHYTTPSSYGAGKEARAKRGAKAAEFALVKSVKICVYACTDSQESFATVCVNRDQLLEYVHMSLDDHVKKHVVGNVGHTGTISLGEHSSGINVVSSTIAKQLLLQSNPTVQNYSMYQNPVKALTLRPNVSWHLCFANVIDHIQLFLASYSTTPDSTEKFIKQAKAVAIVERQKALAAEKECENMRALIIRLKDNMKHAAVSVQVRQIVAAMLQEDSKTFASTMDKISKAQKSAAAADVRQSTAAASAAAARAVPSAAASFTRPKSSATPSGAAAYAEAQPAATAMDISHKSNE